MCPHQTFVNFWYGRMEGEKTHTIRQHACTPGNSCQCPRRLAAGTVNSTVGQFRAIFQSVGLGKEWLGDRGNPAASPLVKQYVAGAKKEQSQAHVTPKQAVPIFTDKLKLIAMYIDRQLEQEDTTAKNCFVLLRDQAFLKLQYFGGDRANDLGQMWTQEIKALPSQAGYMITHTFGKTCRLDKTNTFLVKPCADPTLCPVKALGRYIHGSARMGVNLKVGHLFRPVSPGGKVLEKAFPYTMAHNRLKRYLGLLGIDEGETPHSLRGDVQ